MPANLKQDTMMSEGQDLYAQLGDTHWWLTGRYNIMETLFSDYILPKRKRMLDVGCGPGVVMSRLKRLSKAKFIGVDLSFYGLNIARKRAETASFAVGNVTKLPVKPGSFDAVIAFDVIEHIDNDLGAIEEIHHALTNGGLAFFCVPAFSSLWGYHDDKYGHKRRYKIKEFEALLRTAGFELIEGFYSQVLFFVPMYLFRFIKRVTNNRSEDFNMPFGPLNHFLHKIMLYDFRFFRKHPLSIGCNIFYVATKSVPL